MKLADGLKLAGGGLMLICGFLDWATWPPGGSENAFGLLLRGAVPWVLTVGVGAVTFLLTTNSIADDARWPVITLAATAVATALIAVFMIHPTYRGQPVDRGLGSYLGLIAAAGALAGAYLGYRDRPALTAKDEEYEVERADPVLRRRSHPPLP